jgi:hypothetical protein
MTFTPEPCPHGDIRAACLDCLADPPQRHVPPPAAPVERVGTSWPARYGGHCSGCNTAIHEKQPVCRMNDGTYRHDHCAGEPDT